MRKIFYLLAICTTLASCDAFLDVEPKGRVIPTTVDDYELLLNGGNSNIHSVNNEEILALTADDFDIYLQDSGGGGITINPNNPDFQEFQLYTWGKYRFYNESVSVRAWDTPYENLYTFNKIINEVMDAPRGLSLSDADKLRIQAEALYGRALDYFFLVNIFAKAYGENAATDPAVPIVTKADITQSNFNRASVKEVYDFIISDLEKAILHLPQRSNLFIRPNVWAGYALLSRVNLYKGDYEKAAEYASKALESNVYTLVDYNKVANPREVRSLYQKQQYASRYFGGTMGYLGELSNNFKNNIDKDKDKRYTLFFTSTGSKSTFLYYNASVSVGEMYVTRAECYARLGKKDLAIADLNTLRNHRIADNVDLQPTDFNTDIELVKFCLEERRRELVGSQIRLFDIKRMNLDPNFAITITKEYEGKTYKAEPNSGKLVLPIPAHVLKFNPTW
ncbi:MAG: RagB/SusD family nutrient uptake outer membrane protein [Capnocytophaga felis]|nr:RagB/SusD family nutrient uptake outer membrane protein [Capnocytophaga felis]